MPAPRKPKNVVCPNCKAKLVMDADAAWRKSNVACPECDTLISIGVADKRPPLVDGGKLDIV